MSNPREPSIRPKSEFSQTRNLLRHFPPSRPVLSPGLSVPPLPRAWALHRIQLTTTRENKHHPTLPHTLPQNTQNSPCEQKPENLTFMWHKNTGKTLTKIPCQSFKRFQKRKKLVICFSLCLLRSRSIKILKCKQTFLLQNQIWDLTNIDLGQVQFYLSIDSKADRTNMNIWTIDFEIINKLKCQFYPPTRLTLDQKPHQSTKNRR